MAELEIRTVIMELFVKRDHLEKCSTRYHGYSQCWGRYFLKVTSYLLLVTFSESNSLQLHITSTKSNF